MADCRQGQNGQTGERLGIGLMGRGRSDNSPICLGLRNQIVDSARDRLFHSGGWRRDPVIRAPNRA